MTTSPVLAEALVEEGVPRAKVFVLPCCLGELQERLYGQISEQRRHRQLRIQQQPLRLIFIGRLDSYKRLDWLIEACAAHITAEIHVIGAGPLCMQLESQAKAVAIHKSAKHCWEGQ